jgi:S1-C subfamily serine protease
LAAGLPEIIQRVKPGVVAVGTFMAIRAQQHQPLGTGFAVAPRHVVTNAHVLPAKLDAGRKETYAIFVPAGDDRMAFHRAELVRRDDDHDLALLKTDGPSLPALRLGRSAAVREGDAIAFTGFPLVGVLGLHPATHRGIVSAIAPAAIPAGSGRELNPAVIKRLREPFDIFQLDATAYPGNSGSPLYEADSGRVIGVINSVAVKKTKEAALTDPSGITYAIPVDHVRAVMDAAGVK